MMTVRGEKGSSIYRGHEMDPMSRLAGELYRLAQAGDIDYRVGWIASGFSFARNSGRISGEVEMRLRQLTRRQARALIMRAVRNPKITMGDVASFLNEWHFGVPSLERQTREPAAASRMRST